MSYEPLSCCLHGSASMNNICPQKVWVRESLDCEMVKLKLASLVSVRNAWRDREVSFLDRIPPGEGSALRNHNIHSVIQMTRGLRLFKRLHHGLTLR